MHGMISARLRTRPFFADLVFVSLDKEASILCATCQFHIGTEREASIIASPIYNPPGRY